VNDASIETYKPAQLFETFKVVDDSMLDEMMKEIKAIDMESREPVTAALPNQELSFLKALRKKSVQWMNDEMEFYQKSTSSCNYLPCIREELSHPPADPSVEHLMAASDEFSRRFPFRSVEEEEVKSNNHESSLSKRPFCWLPTVSGTTGKLPTNSFVLSVSCWFQVIPLTRPFCLLDACQVPNMDRSVDASPETWTSGFIPMDWSLF
jgi:hypothetical protein